MLTELNLKDQDLGERKAGILPYLTLILTAIVVLTSHYYFLLPPPAYYEADTATNIGWAVQRNVRPILISNCLEK